MWEVENAKKFLKFVWLGELRSRQIVAELLAESVSQFILFCVELHRMSPPRCFFPLDEAEPPHEASGI